MERLLPTQALRNAPLAAVLVIAWLVLGPARAEAAEVECGQPVVGEVVLDHDLTCAGDGPKMTAGDATLDLGGHEIRGSGSGIGIEIVAPCGQEGQLVVRNGTVAGFGTGVYVSGAFDCGPVLATTVERLVIEENSTGVIGIDSVGPTLLRANTIRSNADEGVVTAFIRPFHIIGNTIKRNGGHGVLGAEDSTNRFEGNVVAHNGGRGAWFSNSVSTFLDNRFVRNEGTGLRIEERICETKPLYEVSRNTAKHNGGGGMTAVFEECDNAFLPGTDNVAKNNSVFQCVLIRCARH